MPDPYHAIGLQRNPFVLEERLLIPPSLWIDRGWSTPPQPKAKQLVQVIGVKGAGKTSHLKHWQAQTGGAYCYYPPGWGRVKMPVGGDIAYWDEADRIPWPMMIVALGKAAAAHSTIIVGTHTSLAAIAQSVGLTVKNIQLSAFSTQQLTQWARQRIEAASMPGIACKLQLTPTTAHRITTAAHGSWREAADLLHIWAAQQAKLFTSTDYHHSIR